MAPFLWRGMLESARYSAREVFLLKRFATCSWARKSSIM
jgi:hypothetical protein